MNLFAENKRKSHKGKKDSLIAYAFVDQWISNMYSLFSVTNVRHLYVQIFVNAIIAKHNLRKQKSVNEI